MAGDPISAGLGLIGAGMSIGQSIKARTEEKRAAAEAQKAIAEAKFKAQENALEGVGIGLPAYDRGFRENAVLNKQGVTALQEADSRSLLGGIGKITAAGVAGVSKQTDVLAEALISREKAIAVEENKIRDTLVELDTAEGTGAQMAAADAANRRGRATASAAQQIGGTLAGIYEGSDLYALRENPDYKTFDQFQGDAENLKMEAVKGLDLETDQGLLDLQKINDGEFGSFGGTRKDYRAFKRNLRNK